MENNRATEASTFKVVAISTIGLIAIGALVYIMTAT
jgi:hypothetical protein